MPFPIPDLKSMAQRVANSFVANLKGSDAWLWPNNVFVASKVFAGITWEVFCALANIDKQRFPDTATGADLAHWGALYKLGQKLASQAQGNVQVPAVYPFTVPANTPFVRSDGITYLSTQSVDAVPYSNTGIISVPVVCTTAGKIGNSLAGTPLLTNMSGLTAGTLTVAVDDDGIGSGADVETEAQYQARIVARIQKTPMGGASYDYEAWAKDIAGVTRVFTVPNAFGKGTVGVMFLMDDTYPQGIPQVEDLYAVQAYLDLVAPVASTVFVLAPVPNYIDIVVSGVSPATQAVYNAVAAELLAMFSTQVTPGLPAQAFTLYRSRLEQAVNNATGEDFNEGVIAPSADEVFPFPNMPVLNTVSFK